MSEHFQLIEVADATFYAGALFHSVFGAGIPTYPRHFVALYQVRPGELRTAGYVHFSCFESVYLVGGLVVDKSLYPLIPPAHLAELGPRPSIGEYLMREGIAALGDSLAVFAFIGDRRSVEVNLNVGYVATHIDQLYAYWRRPLPEEVKRLAAERVFKLAPF